MLPVSGLFLAIDGGQSGTVAVLIDSAGSILGVGQGGPIRHHEETNADAFVRKGLSLAIAGAMGSGYAGRSVAVCCIALTGSSGIAQDLIRSLVKADQYILLESDTFAALASGTGAGGGIGVIAGTGTVALALSGDGQQSLVGGWGWLLGDEGSGFWIAVEALKAAVRDIDGTGSSTLLSRQLPQALKQVDMRGVYNLVTGARLDRTTVAALSTSVVRIAMAGDEVAVGILNSAANHLTDLVVATAAAAPFLRPEEHFIVMSGGVLNTGGWVATLLEKNLGIRLPGFQVLTPVVPPVIGAYYLAVKSKGLTVGSKLRGRIEEQVSSRPELKFKSSGPAVE